MARPHKVYAKTLQIHAGVELIGSKMSLSHKQGDMEVTPIGVKIISRKTRRIVIIPWGNIKGVELLPTNEPIDDTIDSD